MMLEIVRKDVRLLWKYAAAAASLYAFATLQWVLNEGRHANMPLVEASVVVTLFWFISLVQTDSLPSDRQDWLVRPVARRTLIGAKLLTAALFVFIPVMLTTLLGGLWLGIDPARMFVAAFRNALGIYLAFALPAMALGAICRNLAESILAAAMLMTGIYMVNTMMPSTVNLVRHHWAVDLTISMLLLLSACLILAIQYFGRRTAWSRLVALVAIPLMVFGGRLTESTLVAATDRSARESEDKGVTAQFVGTQGPFVAPYGVSPANRNVAYLPVTVQSTSAQKDDMDAVLDSLHLEARFADGSSIQSRSASKRLIRASEGPSYHAFAFKDEHWMRYATQEASVDLTVWVTLLERSDRGQIPLTKKSRHPDLGVCEPEVRASMVEVHCIQAEPVPMGFEYPGHTADGMRNGMYDRPALALPVGPDGAFVRNVLWVPKERMTLQGPVPNTEIPIGSLRVNDYATVKIHIPKLRLADWSAKDIRPQLRPSR